ncbi:hypothetical protein BGZ50_009119 [Haplosporangium sp. Z 11]|nr:hypothetical protein BGZ50_009119 [Haplosporangium sp. Z 11]
MNTGFPQAHSAFKSIMIPSLDAQKNSEDKITPTMDDEYENAILNCHSLLSLIAESASINIVGQLDSSAGDVAPEKPADSHASVTPEDED